VDGEDRMDVHKGCVIVGVAIQWVMREVVFFFE
jgi:hypothetical protein